MLKLHPLLKNYINSFRSSCIYSRMASSSAHRPIVSIVQMCATEDKQNNFNFCLNHIKKSKDAGASFVFLPECFDYIMPSTELSIAAAETLEGDTITKYRNLAKECNVWLSLGGFHRQAKGHGDQKLTRAMVENTHIIIDNTGNINSLYAKTHLFDVDVKGRVTLKESDFTVPGSKIVPPVNTPVGNIGLQICYDVRFPELSLSLRQQGADILTFPSAFTCPTGEAHWMSLLRSRAIENQCYVISAAQVGRHNDKRSSHGHACIIDPWGKVIVDMGTDVGFAIAELDHAYLQTVRANMPIAVHKRQDLYGSFVHGYRDSGASVIDKQDVYRYGHINIPNKQVFYLSHLSYACVNIKPVLPGHILVVPLRSAKRLEDLTPPEVSDLFMTVQKLSTLVQYHYHANSVTVAIQDGPDSGQTIQHVHVHVIPRHPNDMPFNDDIYNQLQTHDKDMTDKNKLRTNDDMEDEASKLRQTLATMTEKQLL